MNDPIEKSIASDEQLFVRIKGDDAAALRSLFERYYTALCRFSVSIVKSNELAEEAVADVFAALWLKRNTIVLRSGLKPYLYGAVRNQSLNSLRSLGFPAEHLEREDDALTSPDDDADRPLQIYEFECTIEALLNRLPPRRRMIFRMNRIDGLSYQEIADILSISVNTVQNQMVEAIKFLTRSRLFHR